MNPRPTGARLAGIITVLAAAVACYGQKPAAAGASASQPVLDPVVDKILTRLESREVHDLRAKVSWKLRYVIDTEEDATTKKGQLWYQQQKPSAKFLVRFTEKISDNRLHKLDERHMFDGRWYVELNSVTKTLIRREIRREGDVGNPYKLGEGPFPLPFGQTKADILKEFEVTLVPQATSDPPNTDHLMLIPREGTQTRRSYKRVEVWVAREGPRHGLPIKVNTAKKDGTGKVNSYITITFEDVRLNQGFSGSVFEIAKPPGYHEETDPLEPPSPPPNAVSPPSKTPLRP